MPSPKALHRLRQFTDPKFDKNGKFIMTSAVAGPLTANLRSPHVIVFDSQGRFFVAHCGNSRVDIFDQDGQCLPRGNRSAGQAESGSKRTILST
jgi:hypothetical protein